MRIRKDVRNGDVVYKVNGWWVPIQNEIPQGVVLKVYDGEIRDLNSNEWDELGFGLRGLTPEAKRSLGEPVYTHWAMAGVLLGFLISIALLLW